MDGSTNSGDAASPNAAAMSHQPEDAIVHELSEGFLGCFLPDAKKVESRIIELTHSQTVLIESIQHENDKFANCKEHEKLSQMMAETRRYHTKLLNLKKDMGMIQEKSMKLKRRALELQQQKQKRMLQLEQQREREMERERQLTAKHAPKSGAL